MLRIVGGELRGRRIKAPERGVRPTAERVREAIFNILGQRLDSERVLDLYAGSGALGIEALSRGALHATFVERSRANAAVVRANLVKLGCDDRAEVILAAVEDFVEKPSSAPYDTIFADPPYAEQPPAGLWLGVARDLLTAGGRLVVEHAARSAIDLAGLDAGVETRRYGDSAVTFVSSR